MLSLNKYSDKILLIDSKNIIEQVEIMNYVLGKIDQNKFSSMLLTHYEFNNNNRIIKHLTFKYKDKETGEIKTGAEDKLSSIGYSYKQKWLHTVDDILLINTNNNRLHVLGCSVSCNEIAYVPLSFVLSRLDELKQFKFIYLDYIISEYGFVN